jgi:hypothetical protein
MPETLDPCGCCAGVAEKTPASVANRPGLSALAYRVGTHGRFKEAMRAALAQQPALRDLTARADDDPTMALLDAWAAVLDVLSFYQERIANEGFLRTATERRSVLELARSIGYELRPGVAASTYLAFTLQTGPGAPEAAAISEGTQAQSLPGQDETPQTFETVEALEARAAWQAMRARPRAPFTPVRGTTGIWLEGVANNLSPGDGLLLVGAEREADPGSERWDFRRIRTVALDRDRALTFVTFEYRLGSFVPPSLPSADPTVYVFRQRAALFGHNAPDWRAMPEDLQLRYCPRTHPDFPCDDWPDLTIGAISGLAGDDFPDGPVYLDALHPKIVPESWVVLARPRYAEVYRVEEVAEDARTGFTLAAKTTRLLLHGERLAERFDRHVRDTVVFAVSEALVRAEAPIEEPVEGSSVVLAEAVEGLAEGRLVAVAGTDFDTGEPAAEVATIRAVDAVDGLTRLTFEDALAHRYFREDGEGVAGMQFNANVARATHGKTVAREVLGGGDGSASFQRFVLKQKPLTHVSAATASGAESTLEVRVDGVRWDAVPSLHARPSDARVYVTRLADDGTATVQFGDGRSGVRLPTGVENVTARYRHGHGLDGMVEAGQISLLLTRPLGVKGVTNPTAPTGAADPETLDDARSNAPLTVLTLDRVVSVQDFEDFAAAFAGVGKAQATVLWNGERRLVHLTVAGADGAAVPEDAALYANLRAALDAARHVDQEVRVASYDALSFAVGARVVVDDAYVATDVLVAVEAALLTAFSFAARGFGQAVTLGEILAVMQAVTGVVAVDLDALGGRDPFAFPRLPARTARWEGGVIRPAELLTIDPAGLILTATAP